MSNQLSAGSATDLPGNPFERGIYLSVGRNGRVDLAEAHKWFNVAAAAGDGIAAQHRDELAREMSRQELSAALKAAREWMTHH